MRQETYYGQHNRKNAPPELADIQCALFNIPPDIGYENWWRVGAALKLQLGEAGFSLFNDWSAGCNLYKPKEVLTKWKSFKRIGGNTATIRTVFHLAIQNGWRPEKTFDTTPPVVDKARMRREAKAEQQRHESKALEATQDWARAKPCSSHHYLKARGIKPHGVRIEGNALLIPMRIGQKMWSLQSIYPNCSKWFMTGAKARGCYFGIGQLTECLWIAEGFATGATVHEVTGHGVICALSGENMKVVAKWFRTNHKNTQLMIAADSGMRGIAHGMAALKAGIASRLVYPDFRPLDGGSDWNDYRRHYGTDRTREALNNEQ